MQPLYLLQNVIKLFKVPIKLNDLSGFKLLIYSIQSNGAALHQKSKNSILKCQVAIFKTSVCFFVILKCIDNISETLSSKFTKTLLLELPVLLVSVSGCDAVVNFLG
jgi:hypothetical protein